MTELCKLIFQVAKRTIAENNCINFILRGISDGTAPPLYEIWMGRVPNISK